MPKNFEIEQLDQDKFIKTNELKMITNPSMFNTGNGPTPDGLLSNEIFGITKDERSGIFAYLDLNEYFIEPYFYKIWLKIDRNLRGVIYETKYYRIDSKGYLVEDDANGETGIKFLMDNINKIKFKETKKDSLLKVLKDNKSKMFTNSFIIIPPFYRDVNTNGDGRVGVGEINKLYINLMNSVKALSESNDYGLSMAGGVRGRIQDIMLEIYNWFTMGESIIGGEHTGAGIFKKFGVMRRSTMSKTSDNSARLVLSSQNLNAESKEELMVNMDYSAVPLSTAITIAYPFITYYLRQFFNNEFGGKNYYSLYDRVTGNIDKIELDNPQLEFSDERFDKEMTEYLHGYSNRLKAIKIPNVENKKVNFIFKGYYIPEEDYKNGIRESENIIERPLTWVDLFYLAAVDSTEDKMTLITRYPVDSYFNQFPTQIRVLSTQETEPLVINGKFYKWYPKIRKEDIGSDTSNMFIDTCNIANPYCGLMGADFDGDQVTVKMAYSVESNEELKNFKDSNGQFITLAGVNGRTASVEAIQAMYNLTLVTPDTELTDPEF